MPKIIWEGNKKEWGLPHDGEALKQGALKIKTSENIFIDSIPYGIPAMLICFFVVFLKAYIIREPPISPLYIFPSFIIGMLVALPIHEFMHAICYPKGAVVWIGFCMRKVAAYAISFTPITRKRYILMSLAPSIWGIISLVAFVCIPITHKALLTLFVAPMFTGLISPCPDYMDIIAVMKQTEAGDMIQASNDGLYKFKQSQ